jgi:hypothetical protein
MASNCVTNRDTFRSRTLNPSSSACFLPRWNRRLRGQSSSGKARLKIEPLRLALLTKSGLKQSDDRRVSLFVIEIEQRVSPPVVCRHDEILSLHRP